MIVLKGHSASSGIAIGRACWIVDDPVDLPHRRIARKDTAVELARLGRAHQSAIRELKELELSVSRKQPSGLKEIFAVHRLMLDDPDIRGRIEDRIRKRLMCAEWAVEDSYEEVAAVFSKMKNRHLAARRDDVKDVSRFLLDLLLETDGADPARRAHLPHRTSLLGPGASLADLPDQPFIAVAHEISPAQTAALISSKVVGMVTRVGGRTAHAAIIARDMGIPLIFGIPAKAINRIVVGETLIIDGSAGHVWVSPTPALSRRYHSRLTAYKKIQRSHLKEASLPARTSDGVDIHLRANIEMAHEVMILKKYGAEGIGLFRTEYLYLRRLIPSEDELFQVYRRVARSAFPSPLVVRTMDLGGDKFLSPLEFPPDLNPMLGMRAIRLCLAQPKLLMAQLRAALRANVSGNIRLCLPMISGVEEIEQVRDYVNRAQRELSRERRVFRPLPLGIMVEVPSVAVCLERYLIHADFFSIGTNDLIQYTLAVSRTLDQLSYLYQPLHPSILRLLWHVVMVCVDSGKDVSICGEEASNPLIIPFFLGVGLREFSMAPPSILDIKKLISGLTVPECRQISHDMLGFATAREVESYIRSEVFPKLKLIIPDHYSFVSVESEL